MKQHFLARCTTWIRNDETFILVRLTEIRGSAPRDQDAVLAVSETSVAGTIGGGRLEWDAIQQARAMLASNLESHSEEIALGPEIGQCCGGRVTLIYQRATVAVLDTLVAEINKASEDQPMVHIYGAGHVGRALAAALAPLQLKIHLIDSRPEELALFDQEGVQKTLTEAPLQYAEETAADGAHVIMTHSHSLDSLLAMALLEKGNFCYLGLIGSETKKALFHKAFREAGLDQALIGRVICPIGGTDVKDKRPEVIAALTAAEIATALLGHKGRADNSAIRIMEGYQSGMVGSITGMHANYYSRHTGFGSIFESKVAKGLAEFAGRLDQPCNQIWLAIRDNTIIGSISIDGEDLGENTAHLRWFIIDDVCRGRGVGRKLLNQAVSFCNAQGFSEIRLWTFKGLDAARHLYESAGFCLVKEEEGQQWGHVVTEQEFVRKTDR